MHLLGSICKSRLTNIVKSSTYSGINLTTHENKEPMQEHVHEVMTAIKEKCTSFFLNQNGQQTGPTRQGGNELRTYAKFKNNKKDRWDSGKPHHQQILFCDIQIKVAISRKQIYVYHTDLLPLKSEWLCLWPFRVTLGQIWQCHWTPHIWFPINV